MSKESSKNQADPVDRINRLRLKSQADRETTRIANQLEIERIKREREKIRVHVRKMTPNLSLVVDAFKKGFGQDQVRVLFVQEGEFVMKAKGFKVGDDG